MKGKGYQYTLPNSFSMSAVTNAADAPTTDRDKGQWGINYYMLDSWILETNATDDNAAIGARARRSPSRAIPLSPSKQASIRLAAR